MSQFAELFKAVKNEEKTPSKKKEDGEVVSETTAIPSENLKPVEVGKTIVRSDKSAKAKNPITKFQQKAADEDEAETNEQSGEQSQIGGKKIGKSRNSDYTQVLTYIRRDTHRQIKKVLIDDAKERDLSDLVEELLNGWLSNLV